MVKLSSRMIIRTQALSSNALLTFQDFLFEEANMSAAMSLGFLPSSQGASQKGVLQPLTMAMVVAA
jgi:hypothetical protein